MREIARASHAILEQALLTTCLSCMHVAQRVRPLLVLFCRSPCSRVAVLLLILSISTFWQFSDWRIVPLCLARLCVDRRVPLFLVESLVVAYGSFLF